MSRMPLIYLRLGQTDAEYSDRQSGAVEFLFVLAQLHRRQ